MIQIPERQPQTSVTHERTCDNDQPVGSHQDSDTPFFYANFCLGFFAVDPLDFGAFAKGQLMVMAIIIPAAIAFFIFFAA